MLLFIVSSLFAGALAIPFEAQYTSIRSIAVQAPAPTGLAQMHILPRSAISSNTCGWRGFNQSDPVLCDSNQECVFDTLNHVVGCCATGSSCAGVYTACSNQPSSVQDAMILNCGGVGGQTCYTNTYANGYLQYGCGISVRGAMVATLYSSQASGVSLNAVMTQFGSTAAPTAATTSTSVAPVAATSQATTSAAPSPTSDNIASQISAAISEATSKHPGGHTSTGTIVGVCLGSLVLIGGIMFGLFVFVRRRMRSPEFKNHWGLAETSDDEPPPTGPEMTEPQTVGIVAPVRPSRENVHSPLEPTPVDNTYGFPLDKKATTNTYIRSVSGETVGVAHVRDMSGISGSGQLRTISNGTGRFRKSSSVSADTSRQSNVSRPASQPTSLDTAPRSLPTAITISRPSTDIHRSTSVRGMHISHPSLDTLATYRMSKASNPVSYSTAEAEQVPSRNASVRSDISALTLVTEDPLSAQAESDDGYARFGGYKTGEINELLNYGLTAAEDRTQPGVQSLKELAREGVPYIKAPTPRSNA